MTPLLFRDDRQQGFPARLVQVNPVSIVPLCHNSAPDASVFQRGGGVWQIHLIKSEQLPLLTFVSENVSERSIIRIITTINNQDDFLEALRNNPQWRDAVRAQILGEDLLQLRSSSTRS